MVIKETQVLVLFVLVATCHMFPGISFGLPVVGTQTNAQTNQKSRAFMQSTQGRSVRGPTIASYGSTGANSPQFGTSGSTGFTRSTGTKLSASSMSSSTGTTGSLTGAMPTTFTPKATNSTSAMSMTPFQTILQKMKMGKKPEIGKCDIEDVNVYCGELVGIFYKWSGHPFQKVHASSMLPMHVPAGKKLLIAVCNFGNTEYHAYNSLPNVPLVPQLIGSIGEKAKVAIQVQKSANFVIHTDVSIESEMYKPESLIAALVSGNIGKEAVVSIKLMDSGNLKLTKNAKKLNVKHSRLVATLVKPTNWKCLEKACFSIKAQNSANVMTKDNDHIEIKMESTSLTDPLFLFKCTNKVAIHVEVSKIACVVGVKKLEMEMGSNLMNPIVLVAQSEDSKFKIEIEESATAYLENELNLKGSSLLLGTLFIRQGEEIMGYVKIEGSANVFAEKIEMKEKSKIIGSPINAGQSKKGILMASVENSGNLMTKESVEMESESKLVGCVIDLKNPFAVLNKAKVCMSGNIRTGKLEMKHDCAVIDNIIASEKANSSVFAAEVQGAANIVASKGSELMKSCVVGDIIKIEGAEGPFKTKIKAEYAGNVLCGKSHYAGLELKDSKLMSSALEVSSMKKEPKAINADVELGFVGNSFVTTKGADQLVHNIVDQEKIGADYVSISQKSVGKMLSCEIIKA